MELQFVIEHALMKACFSGIDNFWKPAGAVEIGQTLVELLHPLTGSSQGLSKRTLRSAMLPKYFESHILNATLITNMFYAGTARSSSGDPAGTFDNFYVLVHLAEKKSELIARKVSFIPLTRALKYLR